MLRNAPGFGRGALLIRGPGFDAEENQ